MVVGIAGTVTLNVLSVDHFYVNAFVLATQLKPDEGTPELPDGSVRVRLQADGSVHDVTEFETEKVDLCLAEMHLTLTLSVG